MKIRNEEIPAALQALGAIKAYRHPRSARGVGQDTALKIRLLTRKLVEAQKDWIDQRNELVEKFGQLRNENVKGSWHVPKDSPNWHAFQEEARELGEVEVEVADRLVIKLSELRVRDEDGEWEPMDEGRIADLGPMLDDEGRFKLEDEKPKAAEPAEATAD